MTISEASMDNQTYLILNRKQFLDDHAETGDVVVPTTEHTVQLDYDFPYPFALPVVEKRPNLVTSTLISLLTVAGLAKHVNILSCLLDHYRIDGIEAWPSKSGNTHAVLSFEETLPIHERIALQAILGSDPTRELLNLARVRADLGDHDACLLLMPRKSAEERSELFPEKSNS